MQLRPYFKFIELFGGLLSPFPCPAAQTALYITCLSRTLKYSSITNNLSALKKNPRAEGTYPIDYNSHQVKSVLGSAKRVLSCAVKPAAPLLPKELLSMFQYMTASVIHATLYAEGGGTYLAMQGASIGEIKHRGDWSSDAVFRSDS